jgi:hypothetical protein
MLNSRIFIDKSVKNSLPHPEISQKKTYCIKVHDNQIRYKIKHKTYFLVNLMCL